MADAEERARHLALAAAGPDAAVARRTWPGLARGARMRGAPDTAAELTELALGLTPEGETPARTAAARAGRDLYLASDFKRAAEVLEQLRAELGPGDLRARALLKLAEIDYWRTGESFAVALDEEALATPRAIRPSGAVPDGDRDERGDGRSGKAASGGPGGAGAARRRRRRPSPALVSEASVPGSAPTCSSATGSMPRRRSARAGSRSSRARGRSTPGRLQARPVAPLHRRLRGRAARLAQAEQAADDEGDESSLANILLNRLLVEFWAGEWARRRTVAERMDEAFAQRGVARTAGGCGSAYVEAYAGRRPRRCARLAGPSRPQEPIVQMI